MLLETEKKRQAYLKFLVMGHPLKELQNMLGTLQVMSNLAKEEELNLLRTLDYIGLRAKDVPLLDRLDRIQGKIKDINMLMTLASQAMLEKTSVL